MVTHHHKQTHNHRHSSKSKKIHMKYMHQLPEILSPFFWDDFPCTTSTNHGVTAVVPATTLSSLIVPLPLHDLYALLRLAVHRLGVRWTRGGLGLDPQKGMGDPSAHVTPFLERIPLYRHPPGIPDIFSGTLLPVSFWGSNKKPGCLGSYLGRWSLQFVSNYIACWTRRNP